MLPPFIIEQIRKREEEDLHRHEQPRLELPLPPRRPRHRPTSEHPEEAQRGVVVIDLV